jgi:hypothetical protein
MNPSSPSSPAASLESKMLDAALVRGDVAGALRLLEQGASPQGGVFPSSKGPDGSIQAESALTRALDLGHPGLIGKMLAAGASWGLDPEGPAVNFVPRALARVLKGDIPGLLPLLIDHAPRVFQRVWPLWALSLTGEKALEVIQALDERWPCPRGAWPDQRLPLFEKWYSPLELTGQADVFDWLVKTGADTTHLLLLDVAGKSVLSALVFNHALPRHGGKKVPPHLKHVIEVGAGLGQALSPTHVESLFWRLTQGGKKGQVGSDDPDLVLLDQVSAHCPDWRWSEDFLPERVSSDPACIATLETLVFLQLQRLRQPFEALPEAPLPARKKRVL